MSDYESSRSSASSDNLAVKQRFGEACILCGYPFRVDVVKILAEGASADQVENLVCFCPNHRREYEAGAFAIVPSPNVRKQMKEHEVQDFEMRQRIVSEGSPDPGRSLLMPPQLLCEFEYVPITVPYYLCVHNKTSLLPETFVYTSVNLDIANLKEYPLRRWDVSVYATLMAAYEPLRNPDCIASARSHAAFNEVVELLDLYKRHAGTEAPEPLREDEATGDEVEEEDDGQGSFEYDDPVITPAILSSRLRWTPAMAAYSEEGSMRWATSSDFVRDPDDPQE
ncbi:hypothetical protein FRC01_010416 [Tulasnella sp. 417]|nr:hypothetical protein FRC01_010416 [Tulasnella sp. 417]